MCQSALDRQETVRFAEVDPIFRGVQQHLSGIAGGIIDEATKL